MNRAKAVLLRTGRILTGLAAVLAFALLLRGAMRATDASAASYVFNPDFCLGGWEKPQNASGQGEVPHGSDPSAYTADNSSYLEPSVASQIFCGYFPIEEKREQPKRVTVRFNWGMKFPEPPAAEPVSEPVPGFEPVPAPAAEPAQEPVSESGSRGTDGTVPAPEEPSESAQDGGADANEPPAENAPARSEPSPESAPAQGGGEPAALRALEALFASGAAVAHAEGVPFIDVSYSLDGVRWTSVGKVGRDNWKDFAVSIPVSTWDDLKKVQIMASAIPTAEGRPPIYLDSMDLVVYYDRGIGEAAQDGLASAVAATDSFLGTIEDGLTGLISSEEEVPAAAPAAAPVVAKKKIFVFAIEGDELPTERALDWHPEGFKEKVAKEERPRDPSFEVGEGGKSLKIEGECSKDYYVVIAFRTPEDYKRSPGSFVTNYAEKCVDGRFEYDMKLILPTTPEGSYYLMVGEQGENDPWAPVSGLVPVKISTIEEDVVPEAPTQ